jgi:GNAT superfamily N-acetyltransferase
MMQESAIRLAGEADFPDLARLIVGENLDPRTQSIHSGLGQDVDGLLQVIMNWATIDEIVFVIGQEGENILAGLGSEYDQELGRGWLWGPFALVEDRVALAQRLYQALCTALPNSIHQLDAFLNLENRWAYEFYTSLGFYEDARAHVYIAQRGTWSGGQDQKGDAIGPEEYASFCALHPAIFPNAYYSAQRVLNQIDTDHQVFVEAAGGEALGYVYASASGESGEGEIEFLGVRPDVRRKGIGRKLLQTGLDWLFEEKRVNEVTLTVNEENVNARKLYEGAGFNLRYSGVGLRREI